MASHDDRDGSAAGVGAWAPPATPLGQLQRGRGAGYRWALAEPAAVVHPLLLACIAAYPKRLQWPMTRDDCDFLADIAVACGLDLERLVERLPEGDDEARSAVCEPATMSVLGSFARRGDPRAIAALRDYVRWGRWCDRALDDLADAGEEACRGLDRVVCERVADDPEPAPESTDLTRSVAEILAALPAHPSNRDAVVAHLVERAHGGDLHTIADAAAHGGDGGRRAAMMVLAEVDAQRLIEIVVQTLADEPWPSGPVRYGIGYALLAAPLAVTLDYARAWFADDRPIWQLYGEKILEEHATEADVPLLRAALAGPSHDDVWRESRALRALTRLQAGPFPEVEEIFMNTAYPLQRADVAENLALSPLFGTTLAVECLWDCEARTRELACDIVDRAGAGVDERLEALTADPHEDVSAAARRRLAEA